MSIALKASFALVGAAGAAGGGILAYKLINKDTISKHVDSKHLLTNVSEHKDKWTHRLNLLSKARDSDLSESLLSKKKEKTTLTLDDLKEWCISSLESKFNGKEDKQFMNTRLYCGLNMGDNIKGTKVAVDTDGNNTNLKANFGKLNGKTKDQLVSELFSIKGKDNANSPWAGSTSLRDWCVKAFDMPFEIGLTYDNAQEYCVISS